MSKIAILLPYKENYSIDSAGAVSLWVSSFMKDSRHKNNITVYGSTSDKTLLSKNYFNIELNNPLFSSKTNSYISKFLKICYEKKFKLIEIHNRPIAFQKLFSKYKNAKYIIYFHNNPLDMDGSKSIDDREFLLKYAEKIVFNSVWVKNKFFKDFNYINTKKTTVLYNSVSKPKKFPNKKQQIIFVGKLNYAKGYDLFGNSVKKILKEFPNWSAVSIGDEKRLRPKFNYQNFNELGYIKYNETLKKLAESEIAVVPSVWDEPFGRTALEATSRGCLTIVSDKGGLKEASDYSILIRNITVEKLYKSIKKYILNSKLRKEIQIKSYQNVKHQINKTIKLIDNLRDQALENNFYINKYIKKSLKILNVYNQGISMHHRLYNISLGKKFTNAFIRNGHDVIEISDRDFLKNKKINLIKNYNLFQKHLKNTFFNYYPDLIIFGHTVNIDPNTLIFFRQMNPKIKIAHWNEDPLMKNGPNLKNTIKTINMYDDYVDKTFVTTHPDAVTNKIKKNKLVFFPVPVDKNIECLNVYNEHPVNDLFYAMSHGVNRGVLKKGKEDDERLDFINSLLRLIPDVKTDFYGIDAIEPIWSEKFYDRLRNSKMALNLSRGKSTKYYSSNRIASLVGNGVLTFVDKNTYLNDFFSNNEIVFYSNIEQLAKLILYYSKNDAKRIKKAKHAKKKYFEIFNTELVCKFFYEVLFNNYNKMYLDYIGK